MKAKTFCLIITLAVLVAFASPASAGWFGDTLKDALQGAGEKGVREAVDAGYDGTKEAGKKAVEDAREEDSEPVVVEESEEVIEFDGTPAQMSEGQWEITMTIEMPGMPINIPPQTFRTCLTPQDAVPKQDTENSDCEYEMMKSDGKTVQWKVTCRGENGVVSKSSGKIVYSGNTFKGVMNTQTTDPDSGTMNMKNTMKGKYLGPCPD